MRYLSLLFLVLSLQAAELVIDPTRLPVSGTWQAAGIPGGIPTRTDVYTTITSTGDNTDRTTDINTALAGAASDPTNKVVVLGAGTFRCLGQIYVAYSNVVLRGAVDGNGDPASIIDSLSGAGQAISVGTQFTPDYPSTGGNLVVASLTKGATSLTVDDSSAFVVGERIVISLQNEATTPVFTTALYPYRRSQMARISSIPNSTHIVIEAPGIFGDYTGVASAIVRTDQQTTNNTGIGVANIHVTGIHGGGSPGYGINVQSGYKCWILNCRGDDISSAPFYAAFSYQCEFRRIWGGATSGGTSTYDMLLEHSGSCLVIDSVFKDSTFGLFQQQNCSGNVIAYTVSIATGDSWINVNHGTWDQYTLVEGCIFASYHNDGFFAGSGYSMVYRNWITGGPLGTLLAAPISDNRYSRYETFVANVIGQSGLGDISYSFGNPNIGNGASQGTASMRGTRSVLTTRLSSSSGTITAPSGHGVTTGATLDLYWRTLSGPYQISNVRRGVSVGPVSGTSIPVSGGTGDNLPASGEDIFVPTTNTALYAYSLDWNSSTGAPKQWTGTLTTRTSGTAGVVTLDSGMATSFNLALAQTSTSYPNERGIIWSTGQANDLIVTNVTGNAVTFSGVQGPALPSASTAVAFFASYPGFQELDLDVILTSLTLDNWLGTSIGGGIPANESIGSATLADSFFLSGTPAFFTSVSLAFPPILPTSPPGGYGVIPAGLRFLAGANTVVAPAFSPAPTTYSSTQSVTLTSSTSGASIFYTTNGTTPTSGSTPYSGAISVSITTTIKAIATHSGMTDSTVSTGVYTITAGSGTNVTGRVIPTGVIRFP